MKKDRTEKKKYRTKSLSFNTTPSVPPLEKTTTGKKHRHIKDLCQLIRPIIKKNKTLSKYSRRRNCLSQTQRIIAPCALNNVTPRPSAAAAFIHLIPHFCNQNNYTSNPSVLTTHSPSFTKSNRVFLSLDICIPDGFYCLAILIVQSDFQYLHTIITSPPAVEN